MNKPFVAVCVPSGLECKTVFAFSLAAVCHVTPIKLMLVRGESSRSAAAARNLAMEKMETMEQLVGKRVDYVFWIDSDMEFPPSTLGQLLAHDKDIVGATYLRRAEPHDLLGVPEEGYIQTTGLAKFRRLPAGLLLVRREVFDTVGRWKVFEHDESIKSMGEDVFFCEKAKEAGYEIWCDLDLTRKITHWGDQGFTAKGEDSELIMFEKPKSSIIKVGELGRFDA